MMRNEKFTIEYQSWHYNCMAYFSLNLVCLSIALFLIIFLAQCLVAITSRFVLKLLCNFCVRIVLRNIGSQIMFQFTYFEWLVNGEKFSQIKRGLKLLRIKRRIEEKKRYRRALLWRKLLNWIRRLL